jgi:hypothetical protein
VLGEFDRHGIAVASATMEIVDMPPLRIARQPRRRESDDE